MEPQNNEEQDQANDQLSPSNPKEKRKKYNGKYLVFVIFIVILSEYYCYIFQIMLPQLSHSNLWVIITLVAIYNLLLGMMIWSFLITMNTHPGEIPLYWGFYIGDDDYKRKRYCLICNAFKPERSHHCSICNVCILNMDHHCPWVDNCIGFYNRKFFMQLLFYLTLVLIYYDCSSCYYVYLTLADIYFMKMSYPHKLRAALMLIGYIFMLILSGVLIIFVKFHINLVFTNSTTIESLDKEHANENIKFKLSYKENWLQVFGTNKLLWFFPIIAEGGRPEGDGLTWKTVPVPSTELNQVDNSTNMNNNHLQNNNNNRQGEENYNSDQPFA